MVSKKDQDKIKRLFEEAKKKLEAEDYEGCIVILDEIISIDSKIPEVWFGYAVANKHLGRHEVVIGHLDKAIHLKPNFFQAWDSRGYAKLQIEQYEEAITDFNEAIRLNSKDASAWNGRGIAKMLLGDYEGAIKLNPQNSSAYKSRGLVYGALGLQIKALEDFFKSLQTDNIASEIIDLIYTAINNIKENNNISSSTLIWHAVFWYLINTAFIVFLYFIYDCTDLLSHLENPLLYFVIILVIWLAPIIYSARIWSKKSTTNQIIKNINEINDDDLKKLLIKDLSRTFSTDPMEEILRTFNKTLNF